MSITGPFGSTESPHYIASLTAQVVRLSWSAGFSLALASVLAGVGAHSLRGWRDDIKHIGRPIPWMVPRGVKVRE